MLIEPPILDPASPVNWDHPVNEGRLAWWLMPSQTNSGGSQVRDLCGRFQGTMTTAAAAPTKELADRDRNFYAMRGTSNHNTNGGYVATTLTAESLGGGVRHAISGWAFLSATTTAGFFGFRGNDSTDDDTFGLVTLSSGQTELRYRGSGITSGTDIAGGYSAGWSHWTLAANGTDFRAWRNGLPFGNTTISATALSNSTPFWILRLPFGGASTVSAIGPVYDVSVFRNRIFTDSSAYELYRESSLGYRTPDSPLNFLRSWSFGVPVEGGGGGASAAFFETSGPQRAEPSQLICH